MQTAAGPKEKSVTVKHGADLFALSNERSHYAQGFSVAEINAKPGNELVRFNNGPPGGWVRRSGGLRDGRMAHAGQAHVKRHLDKDSSAGARIKVLRLLIDRVAN